MRKLENSELERKSVEGFKQSKKTPLVLVLDDVRSLHNIGSVFRTADAFLVEKIILCGITATPPNKEIHKTALGATETVAWEHYENVLDAITALKKDNVITLAIEQVESAVFLQDFKVHQTFLEYIGKCWYSCLGFIQTISLLISLLFDFLH